LIGQIDGLAKPGVERVRVGCEIVDDDKRLLLPPEAMDGNIGPADYRHCGAACQ
jgi:hypothetical protein